MNNRTFGWVLVGAGALLFCYMLAVNWMSSLLYMAPFIVVDVIILTLGYYCYKSRKFYKRSRFVIVLTAAIFILMVLSLDAYIMFLLANPIEVEGLARQVRDPLFSCYYATRPVIQFERDCARYDPLLLYTLKPGTCRFGNSEFDTEFTINSRGLRDDEDSLIGPNIIVLGDSVAMGWGVESNETFASLLEKTIGKRTLNAGVSSYGTVRELMLLETLDLSKADTIILQYSRNDDVENLFFIRNGTLPHRTETEYLQSVIRYERQKGYFPGKYFLQVAYNLSDRYRKPFEDPTGLLLYQVIDEYKDTIGDRKLIILLLSERGLAERLKMVCDDKIEIVNVNTEGYRYILDNHPTAEGHRIIAEALIQVIENESVN